MLPIGPCGRFAQESHRRCHLRWPVGANPVRRA